MGVGKLCPGEGRGEVGWCLAANVRYGWKAAISQETAAWDLPTFAIVPNSGRIGRSVRLRLT